MTFCPIAIVYMLREVGRFLKSTHNLSVCNQELLVPYQITTDKHPIKLIISAIVREFRVSTIEHHAGIVT